MPSVCLSVTYVVGIRRCYRWIGRWRVFIGCQINSNNVFRCSGLAAILNAKLLPAYIARESQITVSYPNVNRSVRYSSVTMACMGLQSLCEIAFFLDRNTPFTSSKLWSVRRWPSDIGGAVGPPWRQLFFSFFAELSASPVNLTAHNFACLYQVILFCSAKETNMFNRRVWNIRSSIWNEGCECRLI